MKKTQHIAIRTEKGAVPARIHWERRQNIRASFGKKAAILRLPIGMRRADYKRHFRWFDNWVKGQLAENERLQQRFFARPAENGDLLKVGERSYTLEVKYADRVTDAARLLPGGVIQLVFSRKGAPHTLPKRGRTLLSRVVAQDFLPEITRRVQELNQQFFQQKVGKVRLKYTHSRWGSCSSKGNINLSTRLLFAPSDVVDYVIIHELAHLIEPNHSHRFWALVEQAMPDFREKEAWLKENQATCDF